MKTRTLRRSPQPANIGVRRNPIAEMNSIFRRGGAIAAAVLIVIFALLWAFLPMARLFVLGIFAALLLAAGVAWLRNR